MKIVGVIINQGAGARQPSGPLASEKSLEALFRQYGVEARVHRVPGAEIAAQAEKLAAEGVTLLVGGGGDGTLNAVANVARKHSLPLGVLPLGTLNHFARDLGIPLELEKAVTTVARGALRAVDLAEVNGQFFLNNSSIGAYPKVVEERDRLKLQKWVAMALAIFRVFRRFPLVRVRLEFEDKSVNRLTPFVVVANNPYQVGLFPSRQSLDTGQLCVYIARCTSLSGLFRLMHHALLGRLDESQECEQWLVPRVTIYPYPYKKSVRVARDGEVHPFTTPLHYTMHPRALQVMVPEPEPQRRQEAHPWS